MKTLATLAAVAALSLGLAGTASATSPEAEIAPQAARGSYPLTSVIINDGGRVITRDWAGPARPIAMRGTPTFKGCRTTCDGSTPAPLAAGCSYP